MGMTEETFELSENEIDRVYDFLDDLAPALVRFGLIEPGDKDSFPEREQITNPSTQAGRLARFIVRLVRRTDATFEDLQTLKGTVLRELNTEN